MNKTRSKRLTLIVSIAAGAALSAALAVYALRDNIQHYYSPSDIAASKAPIGRFFRLGGLVAAGSVTRSSKDLSVKFQVTDRFKTTPVSFEGILPDLFRENQSVVAIGQLDAQGTFVATEVLAKHDENYMPKEVADAIARAKQQHQ